MTNPTAPPKHLSTESRRLWRSVLGDYGLEKHHEVVLMTALEAFDRDTPGPGAARQRYDIQRRHNPTTDPSSATFTRYRTAPMTGPT